MKIESTNIGMPIGLDPSIFTSSQKPAVDAVVKVESGSLEQKNLDHNHVPVTLYGQGKEDESVISSLGVHDGFENLDKETIQVYHQPGMGYVTQHVASDGTVTSQIPSQAAVQAYIAQQTHTTQVIENRTATKEDLDLKALFAEDQKANINPLAGTMIAPETLATSSVA